ELLVLGHDRVQEASDRLSAGQAGAAITLLVEVGEDRRLLVEKAPDPKPVDVDDDIAQMGQCLQRRPLSLPRRRAEPARRRGRRLLLCLTLALSRGRRPRRSVTTWKISARPSAWSA